MSQVKKPMWFSLHSDSAELFEELRGRMDSRSPDSIGGKEFVCTKVTRNSSDGVISAMFQEFMRVFTPWTGEGLPPAETVCEWKEKTGFQWVKATVLFITDSSVVMQREDGFEWQMMTARTVFRPFRTPDQIAAELRQSVIDELVQFMRRSSGNESAAAKMYDAGFRKLETKEN